MFRIWWSHHSDSPSLHHRLQAKGQGASSHWSHLSRWRGGESQEHSRGHQSPGHTYREDERRKSSIYYDFQKPVSLWRCQEGNWALLLTYSVQHHKSPFLNTSKDTPRPEQHYRQPRNLLLWYSWPGSIWTVFWENYETNKQTRDTKQNTKHCWFDRRFWKRGAWTPILFPISFFHSPVFCPLRHLYFHTKC